MFLRFLQKKASGDDKQNNAKDIILGENGYFMGKDLPSSCYRCLLLMFITLLSSLAAASSAAASSSLHIIIGIAVISCAILSQLA
jgi:hypothetical protein